MASSSDNVVSEVSMHLRPIHSRCWFWFVLVGAFTTSSIGVTIVLARNRSIPLPSLAPTYDNMDTLEGSHHVYVKIILQPGSAVSGEDNFFASNGQYDFYMRQDDGDLVLRRDNQIVWKSGAVGGAKTCSLQSDGNLVLRRRDSSVTWQTYTQGNPGAVLLLDSQGQISLEREKGTPIWLGGVSKGEFIKVTNRENLVFPVRGAFYYPWFPETWSVNNEKVRHTPTLGYYTTDHAKIQLAHIDMLVHSRVKLAIASWWGQDTHLDRSRLTNLLNKSDGRGLKWTVYFEQEMLENPSVVEIRASLDYLEEWFAWHENWAYIEGLPIVFVYNEYKNCNVVQRWVEAAKGKWYVILKTFPDREKCNPQPNDWHQYGPDTAVVQQVGYSFSISPGFWKADEPKARLNRLSREDFKQNVIDMVNSKERWQLITTFNEWGEGTSVETGREWASSSGFGYYLDILHEIF